MKNQSKLLSDIETYISARGISVREFGVESMGDPAFVYRMRKGVKAGRETEDCVRFYMLTGTRKRRSRRG